jgi:hypothetical protein
MRHLFIALILSAFAMSVPAKTNGNRCAKLSATLSKAWEKAVPCHCGNTLSNLELTLPSGLRVEAVCGLRDAAGNWIDLAKKKVSLDVFDKQGNMPDGIITLSGQIILAGTAKMEPSYGGDLSFATKCDIPDQPAFLRNFCKFRLENDSDYKKLSGPKPVSGNESACWSKQVTLEIVDPEVHLSESPGAGTYPRSIRVLKSNKLKFAKCYQ